MKKTLWGYSIQEVDETVGYLETQTVKLERQVKQLSEELDKTKKELETANTSPEFLQDAENEDLIAELRQKLEKEENQNRELVMQNDALSNQLNSLSAEVAEKDPFEMIGSICKQAYTDIHTSKQKSKECIESFLKEFWCEWKNYEVQLAELSEKLALKQHKSRESFISYADYILKVYGDIEESNSKFEKQFSEVVKSRSKIECSLNSILSELDKDIEINDVSENKTEDQFEEEIEKEMQEKSQISILGAIQKLNENKEKVELQQANTEQKTENKSEEIPDAMAHISLASNDEVNISQKVNIRNII